MSIDEQVVRAYIDGLLRTPMPDAQLPISELQRHLAAAEPWMWRRREQLATELLRQMILTKTVPGWDTARWLLQQIQNGELVRSLLLLRLFCDAFDKPAAEQALPPDRERVIVLEPS